MLVGVVERQVDDRCEQLVLVGVGRSMSRFLTVRWINRECVDVVLAAWSHKVERAW